MDDRYRRMLRKIAAMSNSDLLAVWNSLEDYDLDGYYEPGISMDDWAREVKGQIDFRGLEFRAL